MVAVSPMSLLAIDAERLAQEATDAFIEGRLRPRREPDTLYRTRNSRYRIMEGIVEEATDTTVIGATLVSWLFEERGSFRLEPQWRAGARAILLGKTHPQVIVTSRVLSSAPSIGGQPHQPARGRDARIPIPPSPPIPSLKVPAEEDEITQVKVGTGPGQKPKPPRPNTPRRSNVGAMTQEKVPVGSKPRLR